MPFPVDYRWIPPLLITWFYGLREGLALTDADFEMTEEAVAAAAKAVAEA